MHVYTLSLLLCSLYYNRKRLSGLLGPASENPQAIKLKLDYKVGFAMQTFT